MNINEAFPSKFLKESDLRGKEIPLTMGLVALEDVGTADSPEKKPVLYFQGKEKGLVLNKTNSTKIASKYGPQTEGWENQPVILYPDVTTFMGQPTPCIRVRFPADQAAEDDDIPF